MWAVTIKKYSESERNTLGNGRYLKMSQFLHPDDDDADDNKARAIPCHFFEKLKRRYASRSINKTHFV